MDSSMNGLLPSTEDYNFEPPELQVDTTDEKKLKRVSRSKQWKQIKEYIEGRQTSYRQYQPGQNPAIMGTNEDWRVATCVVNELQALINYVDEIANGVS
jgi:hypothetical protein